MERFFTGAANPSGFVIQEGWIWTASKNFFSFKPSKINAVCELLEFVIFIVLLGLLGLIWLISPFEAGINVSINRFLFRFMICFVIYMFCVYKSMLDLVKYVPMKTLRQWYSCEHKVMNLLEKGLKPTLKNLKNTSSLSFTCCSQRYFVKLVTGFVVCLLLALTKFNIFSCLGIGIGIWLMMSYISEKIIFSVQYLLLKEPTLEQHKEALRVAKDFLKKYKRSTELEKRAIAHIIGI